MLIKAIRINNHRVRLIQLANGTFAPEVGDLSFALGYRSHDATRKIRATLTNNREVINATKEMTEAYNNVVERDVKRALYFLTEQGLTKLLARTKNDLPETERVRLFDAMRATTPAVVAPAVTKVAPTTSPNRYLTRRDICERAGQKNLNEIQFSEAVANHAKTKYGISNTRGIMRGKYPEIAKMIRVRNKDVLVYSPKFAYTLTPYLMAYVKGVTSTTKQTTPPITVIDMSNGKSVSGRRISLD